MRNIREYCLDRAADLIAPDDYWGSLAMISTPGISDDYLDAVAQAAIEGRS